MIRKKAREAALQFLYQLDAPSSSEGNAKPSTDFATHAKHFRLEAEVVSYAERLAQAVLEKRVAIDQMIQKHANNWRLERLGSIEKTLLRMGVAELLYFKDVPASVTLDEIIELAKSFAEAEAPAFLNGILDPVSKEPDAAQGKVAST